MNLHIIFEALTPNSQAGEKRKEEEIVEMAGPLGKSDVVNGDLESLEAELGGRYLQGQLDAFSTYL